MGVNEAGFVIHSCMHKARPEINCVIHTHTRAGVAVSAMKCGLLPISQHAMMVQADDRLSRLRRHRALQGRAGAHGGATWARRRKAMILRNHGLLTLGETVREAFEVMYYLDCACQIQIDALAGGLHNVQHHVGAARRRRRTSSSTAPTARARPQGLAGAAAHARPQGHQVR